MSAQLSPTPRYQQFAQVPASPGPRGGHETNGQATFLLYKPQNSATHNDYNSGAQINRYGPSTHQNGLISGFGEPNRGVLSSHGNILTPNAQNSGTQGQYSDSNWNSQMRPTRSVSSTIIQPRNMLGAISQPAIQPQEANNFMRNPGFSRTYHHGQGNTSTSVPHNLGMSSQGFTGHGLLSPQPNPLNSIQGQGLASINGPMMNSGGLGVANPHSHLNPLANNQSNLMNGTGSMGGLGSRGNPLAATLSPNGVLASQQAPPNIYPHQSSRADASAEMHITRSLNSGYVPSAHRNLLGGQDHSARVPSQNNYLGGPNTAANLVETLNSREYSPSPLQRGFKNNLTSGNPGNSGFLNSGNYAQNGPLASQGANGAYMGPMQQAQPRSLTAIPSAGMGGGYQNGAGQVRQISQGEFQDILTGGQPNGTDRVGAVMKERERMKALGTHKQMMEGLLDQKFKEFKNIINKSLKEKFDTELKRALFHLWKHYKNCNERPAGPEDQDRNVMSNLRKVHIETAELKDKNRVLEEQVRIKEIETGDLINRQIKDHISSSGNQSSRPMEISLLPQDINQRRYYLQEQLRNIPGEINEVNRRTKELIESRQGIMYETKVNLEKLGRDILDEKSRKLAIELCPHDVPELIPLRNEVGSLSNEYAQTKAHWVESGMAGNPYDIRIQELEQELMDLERHYEMLKR